MVMIPNLIRSMPEGDKLFIRTIPFYNRRGEGEVKKMIHHFRHLPQERKSTEGAFPLFRKNGKGEQLPASRFARGLAGLPAHRQTDQTGRDAEAFLFPVAVAHVKAEVGGQQFPPRPEIEDAISWHGSSSQISP